jgi:hypothetical protein
MQNQGQSTRRRFLKQAGVCSTGAVALPWIVPGRLFGAGAPSNKLNIALWGCGGEGRGILPRSQNVLAIATSTPGGARS